MTVDTMSSLSEMDIAAAAICKCDGLNCALYVQYFLGGFPGGTLIVDTETSMLVSLVWFLYIALFQTFTYSLLQSFR